MLFELTPHKPKQGVIDMILFPAHKSDIPLFPLTALISSRKAEPEGKDVRGYKVLWLCTSPVQCSATLEELWK